MSTNSSGTDAPIRRLDRAFAFIALTLAALSVICFFAIIAASALGLGQDDFAGGIWPIAAAIPLWGLPVAFVLIISLLVMSFVRRGRAAKD